MGGAATTGTYPLYSSGSIPHDADAAAVLPVAAGSGAELVMLERERKAHLRHLDGAELDAARRLPLAVPLPEERQHRQDLLGDLRAGRAGGPVRRHRR